MNEPWYISRAAGMVAYLLIFATVTLGIAVRTRGLDRLVARWRVTDLHRFLSIVCIIVVFIHVTSLLFDKFIGYSIAQVLVPFASPYRSFWTSLGILSAYLLVIITISFAVRRYTGYRVWRNIHYATYGLFVTALAHGIFTGTDSKTWWAQLLYVTTAATVFGLILYRLAIWLRVERSAIEAALAKGLAPLTASGRASERRLRAARRTLQQSAETRDSRAHGRVRAITLAASVTLGVLLISAAAGPFRWFQSSQPVAATDPPPATSPPTSSSASGAAQTVPTAPPQPTPATVFTDSFQATISTQRQSNGDVQLGLSLDGTGARPVHLNVQMLLQLSGGGTTALSNSATLTDPTTKASICSGQVTQLGEGGVVVQCQGSGPFANEALQLVGSFTGGEGSTVTGTLTARAVPTGSASNTSAGNSSGYGRVGRERSGYGDR